ncbi:MAG: hypothetical protein K2Q27_15290 [Novosphingobium sp.]|nr:hypothetical protein [Novosphingobium sp.]
MAWREQYPAIAPDPLLKQAETVFSQRQARCSIIDPDFLGEPGWDILLCAYIAHRKGTNCSQETFASQIGLSLEVTKRWVDFLAARDMLELKGPTCTISVTAEAKLTTLFSKQYEELLQAARFLTERQERVASNRD